MCLIIGKVIRSCKLGPFDSNKESNAPLYQKTVPDEHCELDISYTIKTGVERRVNKNPPLKVRTDVNLYRKNDMLISMISLNHKPVVSNEQPCMTNNTKNSGRGHKLCHSFSGHHLKTLHVSLSNKNENTSTREDTDHTGGTTVLDKGTKCGNGNFDIFKNDRHKHQSTGSKTLSNKLVKLCTKLDSYRKVG